ncbi:MAG: SDR family oxidoreductase [Bacteroidota bacterium]
MNQPVEFSSPGHPVVWVTGASSGIGRSIAESFARIGAQVALSARREGLLEEVAKTIWASGGVCEIFPCDVRSSSCVSDAHEMIVKRLGSVDVLVNNAGINHAKLVTEMSEDQFDDVIATNLRGAFLCAKQVLPSMIEKSRGHIFMISSVAAKTWFHRYGAYSASKAGLAAFASVLREEVRKYGIKVTTIYPGATASEIWAKHTLEKHRQRMMRPEDIGSLVITLYQQSHRMLVEDVIVRPIGGDL